MTAISTPSKSRTATYLQLGWPITSFSQEITIDRARERTLLSLDSQVSLMRRVKVLWTLTHTCFRIKETALWVLASSWQTYKNRSKDSKLWTTSRDSKRQRRSWRMTLILTEGSLWLTSEMHSLKFRTKKRKSPLSRD